LSFRGTRSSCCRQQRVKEKLGGLQAHRNMSTPTRQVHTSPSISRDRCTTWTSTSHDCCIHIFSSFIWIAIPRTILSIRGHRLKIKWIAIHIPNWCTRDVYLSAVLVCWDADSRPMQSNESYVDWMIYKLVMLLCTTWLNT
jgi:hypothetical protein